VNYKFGTKNNWRRWAWNAIRERVVVPPREAVVAYLGAESDLDREIARAKGFDERNLIFIDHSKTVVKEMRERGNLAVCGDFVAAIRAWPQSLPLHAVFGDFTGNLPARRLRQIGLGMSIWPQCRNAVFAFNFLRGRETSGEALRSWASHGIFDEELKKHRGLQAHVYFSLGVVLAATGKFAISDSYLEPRAGAELMEAVTSWHPDIDEIGRRLAELQKVTHRTYASSQGTQRFDSAIWVHPMARADVPKGIRAQDVHLWKQGAGGLRRQLAAIAAHRTRRKAA
jgi:hypothetical protein